KIAFEPVTCGLAKNLFACRLKQAIEDVSETGRAMTQSCILHARPVGLSLYSASRESECFAFPLPFIHTTRSHQQCRCNSGITVTPCQPAILSLHAGSSP